MRNVKLFILILLIAGSKTATSQDSTLYPGILKIPKQYFESVSKKAEGLEQRLDKKSEKVLARMQKTEARLKSKLAKTDSLAAHNIFTDAESKYKQLEAKLKGSKKLSQYIPRLDSVVTSFKFLEQNPQWLGEAKDAKEKLSNAIGKVKELESQLQKAEDIKQFLKERRQYLKGQLESLGFAKELKKINKELFYYSETLREIKSTIQDSKKIERKAIELLCKTKLFQDFFRKNSMLASLFRMPNDPNDPNYISGLAGLQTRAQVNGLIQNQIAAGGPGAQQQFSQNLQAAQTQLQQLKDKVNKWGGGSSEDIMPEGFSKNSQKTKSFWKRIDLGTNIETQRATNIYPIRSDIGLSIGYRLNDKSTIGGGLSWIMGWGTGWNNIRITHSGFSVRSYLDWKLKSSFWISGGYEKKFHTEIRNIDQLRNHSGWSSSGLIGISKVVSVKSKLFKKTKVQLMWDFLSYSEIPRGQPIIFRIGYNF